MLLELLEGDGCAEDGSDVGVVDDRDVAPRCRQARADVLHARLQAVLPTQRG